MKTSTEQMTEVLKQYFRAWQTQDSELLGELFTQDGIYKVKPFGIEQYEGTEQIKTYWEANPVAKQVNPKPVILQTAFDDSICFAEWENTYTTHEGKVKITQGMLLLEFEGGLIKELREHYLSQEV